MHNQKLLTPNLENCKRELYCVSSVDSLTQDLGLVQTHPKFEYWPNATKRVQPIRSDKHN